MPALGADMDAGTVTEWLVHPGDRVARGDIVAIVATHKADLDVEVFESGAVDELLVPVGRRVPVGTPFARIAEARAAAPGSDGRVGEPSRRAGRPRLPRPPTAAPRRLVRAGGAAGRCPSSGR